MHTADDLDLLTLDIIKDRMEEGNLITVFAGGVLRGRLDAVEYVSSIVPSATYWKSNTAPDAEPCVFLKYTPAPRNSSKVTDPVAYKFTRKPQHFVIPVRLVTAALYLKKLTDGIFMLNVDSSAKGG